MIVCSFMGLPWYVAATVISIAHIDSLKMETETSAPGEQPKFLGVRYIHLERPELPRLPAEISLSSKRSGAEQERVEMHGVALRFAPCSLIPSCEMQQRRWEFLGPIPASFLNSLFGRVRGGFPVFEGGGEFTARYKSCRMVDLEGWLMVSCV